jgi:hypothetical protein
MASASNIAITNGIQNWNPQGSNIERLHDNSAYTTGHPDDTLVLVGPCRYTDVQPDNLVAVGMLQTIQVSQSRQVTPAMVIGSGRMFMLAGKAQTQISVQRMFAKGRNLQRALLRGLKDIGDKDVATSFNPEEPAHAQGNPGMVFNLDSELMKIPFGMAVMFRNKAGHDIGSFYLESCMAQSYSIGLQAGQNIVMEDMSLMCDRILPISLGQNYTGDFFNPNVATEFKVGSGATDFQVNSVIK